MVSGFRDYLPNLPAVGFADVACFWGIPPLGFGSELTGIGENSTMEKMGDDDAVLSIVACILHPLAWATLSGPPVWGTLPTYTQGYTIRYCGTGSL